MFANLDTLEKVAAEYGVLAVIHPHVGTIEAVASALYAPLGQGDVDTKTIVDSLQAVGYNGWYVLEQDTVVSAAPAEGAGPIDDARASVTYLRSLLGE